ncbi:MAG: response regulator [Balneolaceae bacterium]
MAENRHILVVDDNASIHKDIESILIGISSDSDAELREMEAELFSDGENGESGSSIIDIDIKYDIDHAYQGEEAIDLVDKASEDGNPYSLIFMDVRMPPGMDGIQTIKNIWDKHKNTEIVICTAYSDYSWEEILSELGNSDKLLFMKKPFDATALKQTTLTLTTKWKLQQESLKYTQKLEEEVKERTKELTQLVADYKLMKEKAEQASEAKSEFLANVSHEIRTPMNGIIGMNDLLLESDLESEQKEYAELVKYSAKALMGIINDILDLAKVEAGKMEIEVIPFDLRDSLKELKKLLEFSAQNKDVEIKSEIHPDIPEKVMGDPMRIRQILLNYGNNAVKFTEKGSIKLKVDLLNEDEKTVTLRFSVKDTGIGIPEQKMKQIFDPFSQADASTTRKYGGTGLGLSICKQLSGLMKGKVGVESTEGKGSEFWFEVTLDKMWSEQSENITDTSEIDELGDDNVEGVARKVKILLAEDNETNQLMTERMLAHDGMHITSVNNGLEVVDIFKKQDFDLILMDVYMPEMDGINATREIRKIEENGDTRIPIIAVSASVMPKDKERIYAAGVDDFIGKPISKTYLMAKVKKWVSDSRKERE